MTGPATIRLTTSATTRFLVDDPAAHVADKAPDDLVFSGVRRGGPLRVAVFRYGGFDAAAAAIGEPGLRSPAQKARVPALETHHADAPAGSRVAPGRSDRPGRGAGPGQNPRSAPQFDGCPRQDSNLRPRLRRAVLYPLSYGGSRCANEALQAEVSAPDESVAGLASLRGRHDSGARARRRRLRRDPRPDRRQPRARGVRGASGARRPGVPRAACAQCAPDVVTLDVVMPRLDGFETLAPAARRPGDRAHPGRDGDRPRTGRGPAHAVTRSASDAYVTKPFEPTDLVRLSGLIASRARTGRPIALAGDSRTALRHHRRTPSPRSSTTARSRCPTACRSGWSSSGRRARSTATTPPTSPCSSPRRPVSRPATWPSRLAERLGASDGIASVDVAGPGFLNIRLGAAAQGEVAAQVVAAGSAYGSSRPARRGAGQPGVRLGQPHRARCTSAAPAGRRSATPSAGSSRRRAPRSPGSTTSTTTARRSTASPGRCSPARKGEPAPEDGYGGALHRRHRPGRSSRRTPGRWTSPRTRRRRCFRASGVELMFDEIKADAARVRGRLRRLLPREQTCTTSGAVERAIKRLTEMGNTYEEDGALWMRTEQVRRRQGPGRHPVRRRAGLHLRRRGLLPGQEASAASTAA